jgi:hypothetical protein
MKDCIKQYLLAKIAMLEELVKAKQFEQLNAIVNKWLPPEIAELVKELLVLYQEAPNEFGELAKQTLQHHLGLKWYNTIAPIVFNLSEYDKYKVMNITPWLISPLKKNFGAFAPDIVQYTITCIVNLCKFIGPKPFDDTIQEVTHMVKKD